MAHNSADIHIEIILILLVFHQYLCLSLMHTIDLITNALHHFTDSSQGNIYAALLALNQHNILRAELLLISANGHTANQKMQANKEKKYSNTSSGTITSNPHLSHFLFLAIKPADFTSDPSTK